MIKQLFFSLLSLLFAYRAVAQTIPLSGEVGRIRDPSNYRICNLTNAPTAVYPIKVKVTNHTNGISDSVFTNSSGLYSVNTIPGIVTAQTYSPSTYAGISTFDLVILSTHRQKTNLMLCPLSRIAADVNKDSKITVTDEDIIRELIRVVTA